MTLEQSIAEAVTAAIAPLRADVQRLTVEVAQLRAALPAQVVTIREAAERLGLSLSTVRRHIESGALPVVRWGKRGVRVDLAAATRAPTEDDVAKAAQRVRTPR